MPLPTPHPLTARDVPELRHGAHSYMGSEGCVQVFSRMIDARAPSASSAFTKRAMLDSAFDTALNAADLIRQRKASLEVAELFFVNDDMTDLALQIAAGLEEWFVTEDTPGDDHGFLVWGKSIPDTEVAGLNPVAAAWSRVGARFTVDTYGYAPAMEREAQQRGLIAKGFKPYMEMMRAGRLAWLGTIDIDQFTRLTGERDLMKRVLLATWLLIREPSDKRQPVHDIQHVDAPRTAQKWLRRSFPEAVKPVRYVTLRKSLRRTGRDEGPGTQAERVYRHRWFVKPHSVNQYYPTTNEHKLIWRGPYLVTPPGCEDAPILGGDRVNVLRR